MLHHRISTVTNNQNTHNKAFMFLVVSLGSLKATRWQSATSPVDASKSHTLDLQIAQW